MGWNTRVVNYRRRPAGMPFFIEKNIIDVNVK